MSYIPISAYAKKMFGQYGHRGGFKVSKDSGDSVLFVNMSCADFDSPDYHDTFEFGFWVDKSELSPKPLEESDDL